MYCHLGTAKIPRYALQHPGQSEKPPIQGGGGDAAKFRTRGTS